MSPELFNQLLINLQKDVRPDFTKFTSEFEFENDLYSFEFLYLDSDSEIVFYEYVNVTQKLDIHISETQEKAIVNLTQLIL